MAEIENKLVFAVAPADARGTVTLMIGVPTAAWEYMADGKTHNFDLSAIGIPVQLMLFGAPSHDEAMRTLEQAAAAQGISLLDERRRDFSIKPGEGA